ncbi:COG4191 Signal transduction histidine kinase regulating C4-dicarboxylate transport system [Vibrio sp. B1FLJ16]|uniref:ATP-binding protein n=1 Tax=Vibrio sp. B1FLJ16 TaxID=2751178 RepID=UPI0015F76781|nr:ATP-binding protein [Vibrio sp. B1FLJ16]CAD7820265.1 COG4191 Signal transduction histidine kinase regulating C4-dicarboxylate transport system [Vibrio sp. B1FLJ16]CAE6942380.1 COG4191 Signal transduction histidine kinase regulating C4-dicarboxylate transport system [Vibrio sp. B1FLJ16]
MIPPKYQTIGARLIAAFTCSTLLLTAVCLVAWATWNSLDNQVQTLLEDSVPKYNASYFLESKTSEINRRVEALQSADNKVQLTEQALQINEQLTSISTALKNNKMSKEFYQLLESEAGLASLLDKYVDMISERIDRTRRMDQLMEQIDWLHQDIRSELKPVRQEVHWQIERVSDSKEVQSLLVQLSTLQRVIDIESALYDMALDVAGASMPEQVDNGIKVIHFGLIDLQESSKTLMSQPTSIAYKQLLQELVLLLSTDGEFDNQLMSLVTLNVEIRQMQEKISLSMDAIHQQIGELVSTADQTFKLVKSETAERVSYGNHVLIVCFSISILTSMFLTYYFINRRIVARLIGLGDSIDAIIKNDHTHPVVVDGNDEIGRLSEKLIEYGEKVQEIQQTNALSLINNTTASLITSDLNGVVESANLSARKLLKLGDVTEIHPIWEYFPERCRQQLKKVFHGSHLWVKLGKINVTLSLGDDEPKYVRFDIRPFKHGSEDKLIMTITDVTHQEVTTRTLESLVEEKTQDLLIKNHQLESEIEERIRTEENLKKTQDELIQAAKMAVVGQTMTSLAHELNQPLNAMSTYLYSARMFLEQHSPEKVDESITHIEGLATRMSKIINSLRQFARKPDGERKATSVSLNEVVEQATTIVNTRAKRQQISIENRLPNELMVQGDILALEQVFINVLVNSCDALMESARNEQKRIQIELVAAADSASLISISDNAFGFGEEIVQRIFQPFVSTKEVGLGLGMNICKSLIERNNGSIYLASSLEKGAMVVLELPNEQ